MNPWERAPLGSALVGLRPPTPNGCSRGARGAPSPLRGEPPPHRFANEFASQTRRARRIAVAAALVVSCLTLRGVARADSKLPVVVWPTLTPAGDATGAALHKPVPASDKALFERSQELDATLRDAVQDLGFTLYVADTGPAPGRTRDSDLLRRAGSAASSAEPDGGTWVVSPRVEAAGGDEYVVRILAVPPRGRELRVRVETVHADSVSARG